MSGRVLTLAERIRDDGSREIVTLSLREGSPWVQVGDEPPMPLPAGALEAVMTRYGKPLAADVVVDGASLDVGVATLCALRHRARYDVIARDFLVWSAPDREPLAELAVTVSAALVHLARAARAV